MTKETTPTQEEPLEPCHHMEDYVSAYSDGSLTGPARWVTWLHLLHCRKCSAALRGLRALRDRLRALSQAEKSNEPQATLTAERRAALEKAFNGVDQRQTEGRSGGDMH